MLKKARNLSLWKGPKSKAWISTKRPGRARLPLFRVRWRQLGGATGSQWPAEVALVPRLWSCLVITRCHFSLFFAPCSTNMDEDGSDHVRSDYGILHVVSLDCFTPVFDTWCSMWYSTWLCPVYYTYTYIIIYIPNITWYFSPLNILNMNPEHWGVQAINVSKPWRCPSRRSGAVLHAGGGLELGSSALLWHGHHVHRGSPGLMALAKMHRSYRSFVWFPTSQSVLFGTKYDNKAERLSWVASWTTLTRQLFCVMSAAASESVLNQRPLPRSNYP